MVRVSLPFRGAAVVLLCASAAAGQTALPATDFSDELLGAAPSMVIWQPSFGRTRLPTDDFYAPYASPIQPVAGWYETEMSPTLETGGDTDPPVSDNLASFDASTPKEDASSKDADRLKPTPSSAGQGTSPQSSPLVAESCDGLLDGQSGPFIAEEEFPCAPTFLPFACPPSSWHKCRRKHRHCAHGGCGNAYFGGPWGCPDFCAPSSSCGRRCHRRHRHNNYGMCPAYGFAGCAGPWGMGCDGFMGAACPAFFCPPPGPACSCRRCQRKHACHAGCGGYAGFDDGYGAFDDLNCYGGGCGHHRCGLFHRCHARRYAPPPCPYYPCYGFAMQPYMDMGMGMDMGMDMGFCPDCSMNAGIP